MGWRSRIVGHDRIDPEQLTANPHNHRKHPQHQRDVVRDSIAELGFVKSVLVNRTTGFIVDGHERVWQALDAKQSNPGVMIDVEYVELSEDEERKALAILDMSTGLAEVDQVALDELVRFIQTGSEAIAEMLADAIDLQPESDFDLPDNDDAGTVCPNCNFEF
jgi:ParB-like chromosome segregation protein Spo0J